MSEIDTSNDQLVSIQGNDVIVQMPKARMTKAEALRHAAWLVALADGYPDQQFPVILEAVYQS
jgi:hypothetical protein